MRKIIKLITAITLIILLSVTLSAEETITPKQLFDDAKELSLGGKFAEAKELYQKIINKYPESEYTDQASFWHAYAYEAEGNLKQAVVHYGLMIKKFPESKYADDALKKRADLFRETNNYSLAVQALGELTSKYPQSNFANEAYRELGNIYGYQLGEFQKALESYNKYQASDTLKAEIKQEIKFFMNNQDYNGEPLTVYIKARRKYQADKMAEADKELKKLIVDYPKALVIDDALILLGDNEIAKAIRLRQQSPLLSQEQKTVFLNFYQQATKYYQQVIRDFPKLDTAAEAQYSLGKIYDWDRLGGLNDFARAQKEYQAVVNNYPDSYWAALSKQRLEAIKEIF